MEKLDLLKELNLLKERINNDIETLKAKIFMNTLVANENIEEKDVEEKDEYQEYFDSVTPVMVKNLAKKLMSKGYSKGEIVDSMKDINYKAVNISDLNQEQLVRFYEELLEVEKNYK